MNNINRLNELSICGTQSKALELKKIQAIESFKAAVKKSSIQQIKSNENFERFYEELNYHFTHFHYPVSVTKIHNKNGEYVFITDNKVTVSEDIIKIYKEGCFNITFIPHDKGIELYKLEMNVTGRGLGSIFMKVFTEISIKTGIAIYLVPGVPGFNTASNKIKLYRFYNRFNFKKIDRSKYWSNCYINGNIRPFITNN